MLLVASDESVLAQKMLVHPDNRLNELPAKTWVQETCSVWFQKGLGKDSPQARIEREHPAPFSFTDIMRLVKYFTKSEDKVLDPFCGVASTLKACVLTGREGVGIELISKWAKLGEKRLEVETPNPKGMAHIIVGDAREKLKGLKTESFDYLVTSPPYWQILAKKADHKVKAERIKNGYATKYSDDKRDLGNITDYNVFLVELKKCFSECYRVLKKGKYGSIIVSDFRHNSTYQAFHADVINMMGEIGFKLKGITILYQNSKTLYPYGYPYAYVPNIHHQYILNFQKPNGEKLHHWP